MALTLSSGAQYTPTPTAPPPCPSGRLSRPRLRFLTICCRCTHQRVLPIHSLSTSDSLPCRNPACRHDPTECEACDDASRVQVRMVECWSCGGRGMYGGGGGGECRKRGCGARIDGGCVRYWGALGEAVARR